MPQWYKVFRGRKASLSDDVISLPFTDETGDDDTIVWEDDDEDDSELNEDVPASRLARISRRLRSLMKGRA